MSAHLLPNPFLPSFHPKYPQKSHYLPRIPLHSSILPQKPTTNFTFCPLKDPIFTLHPLKIPTFIPFAGRGKKKPSSSGSGGRIEGSGEIRRQARAAARRRSRRLAENLFFRKYGPNSNHPDYFSEEELQMIGLGYDRSVRFFSGPDDPRLRHPFDWYKYGEFGPYSWRGIVVGPPIRGRFSDERVTLISEVRDHEEWERIEQFDMSTDFSHHLKKFDKNLTFRYFWVFVRHPRWHSGDLPWQQWTLVAEVVLEAGKQRLDKWSLMARLGNKARAMVTQCAAWFRPDIIYVKRPVYQCRFEPQDDFFKLLAPLLDPETEGEHLFELRRDDGRVDLCTYYAGLCRIVKVNQKAYVDDVVNAYEKLSDEGKSECLYFLLGNHPMELLHPWTKEWKAKLEELELGCDAPDESDDDDQGDETRVTDWIEEEDGDEEEDEVVDVEEDVDDEELDVEEDVDDEELDVERKNEEPEENPEYWNQQWEKAVRDPKEMEKFVTKSVEFSSELFKREMKEKSEEGEDLLTPKLDPEQIRAEWENAGYRGGRRRVKKSRVPPELFLRAAVRPFTYRNLVKEIVLTRHAIIEGEIKPKS